MLHGLALAQRKLVLGLSLTAMLAVIGSGVLAHQLMKEKSQDAPVVEGPAPADLNRNPLPAGALVRMDETRFRHGGDIHSLAFSADGTTLASASADQTIALWEAATGKNIRTLQGHRGAVRWLAFAPDRKHLVSASHDDTLKLWETASGREIQTFGKAGITSDIGTPRFVTVAFSPDGTILASATMSHTIRCWETATGKEVRTLQGHPGYGPFVALAFSRDGNTLAAAKKGLVQLWETGSGKEIRGVPLANGSENPTAGAFSPDGKTLAVTDSGIRLWEMATGKEIRSFYGHQGNVSAVAFSPDGKTLASGGTDHTVRLWETASGKEIRAFHGHEGPVSAVAFAPDGKTLASASSDTTTWIWAVSGRTAASAPPAAERLPNLWEELADPDTTKAHDALWTLASAPREALPFLAQRLKTTVPEARLQALIADLESNQFAVRHRAAQVLERLGDAAIPALHAKLKDNPGLEMTQRLEELLKKLDGPIPCAAQLRIIRAVQVLEQIGNAAARTLLEDLAQRAPTARLAQEARAAVERLSQRPVATP